MIGVIVMKAPLFDAIPGVAAVFVGRSREPRPDPASLAGALGLPAFAVRCVVTAAQIHSDRVLLADESANGGPLGEGDAIVTLAPGVVLGIGTADCLPIVACDPAAQVLGVAHAGWRGTVSGVLEKTLASMSAHGARMERTRIAIGPSARVCCYEVGSEVIDAFFRLRPAVAPAVLKKEAGRTRLDLVGANRLQAMAAGVRSEAIEAIDVCSICRADLCHSYRREGPGAGRMWLLAALTPLPVSRSTGATSP